MNPLFLLLKGLVPLAYLWALIAYWRAFFSEEETFARGPAKSALTAVLAAHTTLLVFLALRFHRFPLGSLGEALLFLGWILALLHLLSEWSADTRRLGLFTLSPAAACALPSIFLLSRELGVPAYRGTLFIFHIVASLASYAAFSLAAVLAALYLTQHRNLKQKRFDLTFRKLPPLDKLDRLAATWAFLGTLLMIVSSVIGVWWVQRDDLSGMSIYEAGIIVVLLLFLALALARRVLGWRGRRHALWLLAGFAALVVSNLLLHGLIRF